MKISQLFRVWKENPSKTWFGGKKHLGCAVTYGARGLNVVEPRNSHKKLNSHPSLCLEREQGEGKGLGEAQSRAWERQETPQQG